jgi:Tfp pilus assembly protein PilV
MKLHLRNKHINYGQTLFEVVIAVGMAAVIHVGTISLSTLSVRNTKFASKDSLATKHAQAAMEFLREERDANWSNFYARASGGIICIHEPPSWGGSGLCSIGQPFRRGVTLRRLSSELINAEVVVEWTDSQGTHAVNTISSFTRWK